MRKPLILLVDDDPAVLDALEAALAPAFEQIACVETFASGQAVLDAVPGWKNKKRPIAVAIVDQKMPGMTGVELLTRLRGAAAVDPAHPAANMGAILLTGYAGLESALAAKNEAGVERYLEKPWNNELVSTAVTTALVRAHRVLRIGAVRLRCSPWLEGRGATDRRGDRGPEDAGNDGWRRTRYGPASTTVWPLWTITVDVKNRPRVRMAQRRTANPPTIAASPTPTARETGGGCNSDR